MNVEQLQAQYLSAVECRSRLGHAFRAACNRGEWAVAESIWGAYLEARESESHYRGALIASACPITDECEPIQLPAFRLGGKTRRRETSAMQG